MTDQGLTKVVLDVETYFDNDYSLRKMTMTEYINHPEFKLQSIAIKINDQPTQYFDTEHLNLAIQVLKAQKNWAMIAHNTAFDAAVLNWHYGIKPDFYVDTMSMSRGFWPTESASLDNMTKRLFPNDATMRKGKELVNFLGVKDLTPAQHAVMKGYNIQDVDLTYASYHKMRDEFGYPDSEMYQIHMVIRMYAAPMFYIDRPLLEKAIEDDTAEREHALDTAMEFIKRTLAQLPKEKRQAFDLPLDNKLLSSNQRYARLIGEVFGLKPPRKENAKGQITWAFSKKDVPYIEFQNDYPELQVIYAARELAKSTIGISRAETMLRCSAATGYLPVPLRYYGAITGRMSGCLAANAKIRVLEPQTGRELEIELGALRNTDLVWDGEEYVQHGGLQFSGVKEVTTDPKSQLTATPDHLVFNPVTNKWQDFGDYING